MLCPMVWGTSPDLERRGFEKAVLSGALQETRRARQPREEGVPEKGRLELEHGRVWKKRLPSQSSGTWTTQGDTPGKEQSPTWTSWQTPFSAPRQFPLFSPPLPPKVATIWRQIGAQWFQPQDMRTNWGFLFHSREHRRLGSTAPAGGLWAARCQPPAPGASTKRPQTPSSLGPPRSCRGPARVPGHLGVWARDE